MAANVASKGPIIQIGLNRFYEELLDAGETERATFANLVIYKLSELRIMDMEPCISNRYQERNGS